jgi:hypothetical protein
MPCDAMLCAAWYLLHAAEADLRRQRARAPPVRDVLHVALVVWAHHAILSSMPF